MTTYTVSGMMCGGCEETVESAVGDVAGVTGVEADHESDTVRVEGDADRDAVQDAVADAGYEVQ